MCSTTPLSPAYVPHHRRGGLSGPFGHYRAAIPPTTVNVVGGLAWTQIHSPRVTCGRVGWGLRHTPSSDRGPTDADARPHTSGHREGRTRRGPQRPHRELAMFFLRPDPWGRRLVGCDHLHRSRNQAPNRLSHMCPGGGNSNGALRLTWTCASRRIGVAGRLATLGFGGDREEGGGQWGDPPPTPRAYFDGTGTREASPHQVRDSPTWKQATPARRIRRLGVEVGLGARAANHRWSPSDDARLTLSRRASAKAPWGSDGTDEGTIVPDSDRSDPARRTQEPRTVLQRVRMGLLLGIPVGLLLGAGFALMLPPEHQTVSAWAIHLVAGLFAAVTFGGFVGAMAGPRNREH